MKLGTKLVIAILFFSIIMLIALWNISNVVTNKIDQAWADRYIEQKIQFDKYRTLMPIIKEVEKVNKLAQESSIIAMALNENNATAFDNGMKTLEQYRLGFESKNYFVAFSQTNNYYYKNVSNEYKHLLSQSNPKDKWFFVSLNEIDDFAINIDADITRHTTHVWINKILKTKDNKVLGIIGTGLDFSNFITSAFISNKEGIKNYFVDSQYAVQLAQDKSLIDFASITKTSKDRKTIDVLFNDTTQWNKIKQIMIDLKQHDKENSIQTIMANVNGVSQLIGIAYIKEIDWYSFTIIQPNNILVSDHIWIFVLLGITHLIMLFLIYRFQNRLLIKPLEKLKNKTEQFQNTNTWDETEIIGEGEISDLSIQFNHMIHHIKDNAQTIQVLNDAKITSIEDMISNIAHQWRQPLSVVATIATGAILKKQLGILSDEDFYEYMESINNEAQELSKTIDTFSKIIRKDQITNQIKVQQSLEEIVSLIQHKYSESGIDIIQNFDLGDATLDIVQHELMDVIFNILNNAKEAFGDDPCEKQIKIHSYTKKNNIVIDIEDNAGGIDKNILPNIFEPYFTTKHQSQGKGLGLYVCYQIITKSFGGTINVSNIDNGTKVSILIPQKI